MAEVLQTNLDPLHQREGRFCTPVAPGASAEPEARGSGAAAVPPAPALEPTSGFDDGDRRRHKCSRSETRDRSRYRSRERHMAGRAGPGPARRHGGHGTWIPTMEMSTCATP